MPTTPIELENCTPYLSTVIFQGNTSSAADLTKALKPLIKSDSRILKKQPLGTDTKNNLIHYLDQKMAPWYTPNNAGDALKNRNHHAVFITVKGDLLGLTFTDSSARDIVVKKLKASDDIKLSALKPISMKEMEMIFVNEEIRTLWLSGAHSRSAIKPDSKVLSGQELENALSPIGDQTYFFSSIRSTLGTNDDKYVLGTSPGQSRIWLGPSKSWNVFETRINTLLGIAQAYLRNPETYSPKVPVLAQYSENLDDLGTPYDFALIVPENLSPDFDLDTEDRWFQLFADTAIFKVTPDSVLNSKFKITTIFQQTEIGSVDFTLEKLSSGKIVLKSEVIFWEAGKENDVFKQYVTNPELATVYFDSGHSFSRNRLIETRFRDQAFENWSWAEFSDDGAVPTDITKEKPGKGSKFIIGDIGADNDTSLFGYLVKGDPSISSLIPPTGWLVCDDGSMESADFIHLDLQKNPNVLSLIHVKGSGSDNPSRGISTGDYEVVIGQAVKNLRNTDKTNLINKLDKEKGKKIGKAVWLDGEYQGTRDGFLDAFEKVTENFQKRVVVFQPGVKQSILNQLRTNKAPGNKYKRLQQLDALLLSAQSSCYELGAEFIVLADKS